MPTFILSLSWTDQGIRSVKDSPKRGKAVREFISPHDPRSTSSTPAYPAAADWHSRA
jgi:hypothetical protein